MPSSATHPWRHDSELAMVRDMIFPHHATVDLYSVRSPFPQPPDRRAGAINTISSWRLRTPLPHALTATVELVGARLFAEDVKRRQQTSHDQFDFQHRGFADDLAVRSTFATSFCRFVNGFVDKDVVVVVAGSASAVAGGNAAAGGGGESSMFVNAAKIGLPTLFVEFRHRCTHGRELPSLQDLKIMNGEALEWLYGGWWKVHATGDPGRAVWEEEEREREVERVEEFHRELDEKRQVLREQLERAEKGGEMVTKPTVLVCGRDGGQCRSWFLLEFDLKRHRKGFHQEDDGN